MKMIVLSGCLLCFHALSAQSIVGSINSGCLSDNGMVYSVGEVFVIPDNNPDEAGSGLVGALSQIAFFVSGTDDHSALVNLNIYPNPAEKVIHLQNSSDEKFGQIFIYSLKGEMVMHIMNPESSIDLGKLPAGIYTILTDNKNIPGIKILKQ